MCLEGSGQSLTGEALLLRKCLTDFVICNSDSWSCLHFGNEWNLGIGHSVRYETYGRVVDHCGISVSMVVNQDVKALACKVANDIQKSCEN